MLDISRIRGMLNFKKVEPVDLELALNSAIQSFVIGTRRLWTRQEDYVEDIYIDPDGPFINTIWFKLYPIETISLVEWSYGETVTDATTVDTDNYNLILERGKVIRESGFNYPFVRATITGGYTNDQMWSLFPDIISAIITEIKYSLKREDDANIIVNSQGFEGGSTSLKHDLHHPKFIAAMRRYRRLI
jgi:hypothetical protein